jgi:hypothetical protein
MVPVHNGSTGSISDQVVAVGSRNCHRGCAGIEMQPGTCWKCDVCLGTSSQSSAKAIIVLRGLAHP